MKKVISLVLAMVMIMALATTAFAAPANTTLTINTTTGHTYTVYQLITGELSGLNNGTGKLSNTAAGSSLVDGKTVDDVIDAVNGKVNGALGDAAYALVDIAKPFETVVGDGSANVVNVVTGYYVVVDSWTGEAIDGEALSRYLVAVAGATEMTPKVTTTEIDKKIIDTDANAAMDDSKKTDTAAIGDTIEFEITGTVPNPEGYKYYYYVLDDTMSAGLDLVADSFVVTVGADTLTKDTDYYVYINGNDFELAFEDIKELVDDGTIVVGEDISVKYNATINDAAEVGKIPNTNDVKLIYSNNPGSSARNDVEGKPGNPNPGNAVGETPVRTTKTYVTELTILKVDENNKALDGAAFTLTGDNLNKVIVETATSFRAATAGETANYYELTNGTFTKTAPNAAEEGEEGYNADKYVSATPTHVRVTTITNSTAAAGTPKAIVGEVNEAGYVTFTGLNAGSYTLTETTTPEGYNTIAPITFTISATQSGSTDLVGGNITWASDNAQIVLDATNGVFDSTIVNVPGDNLPTTGGMGTTLFYVFGTIMVLGAAVLLVTKKRMTAE